jgi:tetratricopeptide (TPR) repeat protein
MAKVSLRGYNTEIDQLIDNNQLDEAIAHCIHILGGYPKHADSYRLLGKAFLERQRYNDAADMFLRVLAIFPDDFVAHIGISIVREELSDLNLAVFHMERAFEVQPTNTAIQEELKRLYGKRDGIAPAKIRLTHPALARLYSKGDLNQQALGELSVALSDSPSRPDILAQLAELYTKDGQNSEAIETCNKLIENLPYCFGALNVLTRLLPGTPFAQDVPIYQARIVELDPYFEFKTNISQAVTDVPDDAVMIEPLIWSPDSELEVNKADWANSLGIKLIEPQQVNAELISKKIEPATFSTNDTPTQPRVRQPATPAPTQPAPQADIPDWMQSAGWSKPDESLSQEVTSFPSQSADLAGNTTPPPVKSQTVDTSTLGDAELSPALQKIRQETDNLPELLAVSDPSKRSGDTDSLEPAASISPEAIPDWLRSIAPADLSATTPEGSLASESGISKKAIDDAFSSLFPVKNNPIDKKEEPTPLADKSPEAAPPEHPIVQPIPPTVPEAVISQSTEGDESFSLDDLRKEMDTVSSLINETAPEDEMEKTPASEAVEIQPEGDALENLRSSFPSEKIPEMTAESPEDDSGVPTGPLPEIEPEIEVVPTPEPAPAITGEIPNWLQDLGDGKTPTESKIVEASDDELPAWLQDFEQKIEDQPPAPVEPPVPLDTVVVPSSGESSGWRMPSASKTDSKFHTTELPELPENEPADQQEQASTIDEVVKEKSPAETSELTPEPVTPPFSGGDTTIIASPLAEEGEIEERPAWLSKLIGIDDVEPSSPEKSVGKPPQPTETAAPVNYLDEISGASQAAWIVDMMSGKETEVQPSTITPEEPPASTGLSETPLIPEEKPITSPAHAEPEIVMPAEQIKEPEEFNTPAVDEPGAPPVESEPVAAAVNETPEVPPVAVFGEHEGVPDLSLIVEGLQAAWMSEHVEDGKTKHTGSLMDIYAPKPDAENNETIIIDRSGMKPVEPQPEQEQPEKMQSEPPQPEQVLPEKLQPEPPQREPLQPEPLKPEPLQPAQTIRISEPEPAVTPAVVSVKKETPPPVKQAQPVMIYPAEDVLKDARTAFSHGILDTSLDRYLELITHNRLVESVIEDLESMTNSQPDHSEVWQTLGDAYIRRNKLDQALSAYLKAEDLLK